MRDFTKEEIAYLETIETRLWQTQHGYLSTLHSDQKEMVQKIYKDAGGTRNVVWGCGRCWLDIVKEMAVIYFRQKEAAKTKPAAEPKPRKKKSTAK